MCGGVDSCTCQPLTKTQTRTKVMQLDLDIRWDFFLGRFFFSLIIVLIFKNTVRQLNYDRWHYLLTMSCMIFIYMDVPMD